MTVLAMKRPSPSVLVYSFSKRPDAAAASLLSHNIKAVGLLRTIRKVSEDTIGVGNFDERVAAFGSLFRRRFFC